LDAPGAPAVSSLHTVSLPPISLALSRMPRNPKCPSRPSWLSSFGSMPLPSSRTRTRSRRSRLLDELATTLAGVKIHEWEALIV